MLYLIDIGTQGKSFLDDQLQLPVVSGCNLNLGISLARQIGMSPVRFENATSCRYAGHDGSRQLCLLALSRSRSDRHVRTYVLCSFVQG